MDSCIYTHTFTYVSTLTVAYTHTFTYLSTLTHVYTLTHLHNTYLHRLVYILTHMYMWIYLDFLLCAAISSYVCPRHAYKHTCTYLSTFDSCIYTHTFTYVSTLTSLCAQQFEVMCALSMHINTHLHTYRLWLSFQHNNSYVVDALGMHILIHMYILIYTDSCIYIHSHIYFDIHLCTAIRSCGCSRHVNTHTHVHTCLLWHSFVHSNSKLWMF